MNEAKFEVPRSFVLFFLPSFARISLHPFMKKRLLKHPAPSRTKPIILIIIIHRSSSSSSSSSSSILLLMVGVNDTTASARDTGWCKAHALITRFSILSSSIAATLLCPSTSATAKGSVHCTNWNSCDAGALSTESWTTPLQRKSNGVKS